MDNKISLFDHRLKNACGVMDNQKVFNCACGKVYYLARSFYIHQKKWLNAQLNQYGIEVV